MPSVIVTPPTAVEPTPNPTSTSCPNTPSPITPDEPAAPSPAPLLLKTTPTAEPTGAIPLVTTERHCHTHTHTHTHTMGHKTRKGILYTTAFFVPPLAVYFRRGTDKDFALNILLTILGWYVLSRPPPFPIHPVYPSQTLKEWSIRPSQTLREESKAHG